MNEFESHRGSENEDSSIADKWQRMAEEANRERQKAQGQDRPLKNLQDSTIEGIASYPKLHENDREMVNEELEFREQNPEVSIPDSHKTGKEDLKDNYFILGDGRLHLPTDEFVQYREGLKKGEDINQPKGPNFETIEERNSFDHLARKIFEQDNPDVVCSKNMLDNIKTETVKRLELLSNNPLYSAKNLYSSFYFDGLRNGNLEPRLENAKDITKNFEEPTEYYRIHGDFRTWRTRGAASKIVNEFGAPILAKHAMGEIEKISPEEKQKIESQQIERAIRLGGMTDTIVERPDAVDVLLQEHEIDKNSDSMFDAALGACQTLGKYKGLKDTKNSERAQRKLIDYFDLGNGIIKRAGDVTIERWGGFRYDGRELPPVLNSQLLNEVKLREQKIVAEHPEIETIWQNTVQETFLDQLSLTLPGIELKGETSNWEDAERLEQIEQFKNSLNALDLNKERISIENPTFRITDDLKNLVIDASGQFSHLIGFDRIADLVEDNVDRNEISVDSNIAKEKLNEALRGFLKQGATYISEGEYNFDYRYSGKSYNASGYRKLEPYYLSDIFESEGFKKNQEALGFDFEDPEVINLAFDGLMNVIRTENGEKSEAASWYYNNILCNDPDFGEHLKAYRIDANRGTKAKITKFLKENPQIYEDMEKRSFEEKMSDEQREKVRDIKRSVVRNSDRQTMKNLIHNRQAELIDEFKNRGAAEISTFEEKTIQSSNKEEKEYAYRPDNTPVDFGIEKVKCLLKYGDYIEANIDSNAQYFDCAFPDKENGNVNYEDAHAYHGVVFNLNNKQCVIAESFNGTAAMYVSVGEFGSDFKEMFDASKYEARNLPGVANINHLDKEHFDEDLDATYRKAFLFLRSANLDDILYTKNGGKEGFDEMSYEKMPAWPMSEELLDEIAEYADDIKHYHDWQRGQASQER